MTARQLLDALQSARCRVRLQGPRLAVGGPVPAHLKAALSVLHTGVRAVLAGRKWYGTDRKGHGCGRNGGELNPAERLPPDVHLLTVAGDGSWDRLPPGAPTDLPELFAPPPPPRPARRDAPTPRTPHLAETPTIHPEELTP